MTTFSSTVRPPNNDTEERLLEVALTLFAEKGYGATTVREIIEAAGVTRPVLYYYCASKEDLFKRIFHWKHDQAYRELAELMQTVHNTKDRLLEILRGSFEFCVADPRVPQLMFQTAYGPNIPNLSKFIYEISEKRFSIIRQIMQDGLDRGELTGDATSLAMIFCCLMDQHMNVFARFPNPESQLNTSLANKLLNAFLYGVASSHTR